MIDLISERVMTLAQATKHLPRRRKGKKPHASTIYRWATNGVQGTRLEVIRVGGTLCTSLEELQRFCERLTGADSAQPQTTRTRKREIARAKRELKEAGIQ